MDFPHRRYNSLLGEWVIVAPHRITRPWHGQDEKPTTVELFDENNPLCPNGKRIDGTSTPAYKNTYTFDNDFPALLANCPDTTDELEQLKIESPFFKATSIHGLCKVICFHPDSRQQLATMTHQDIMLVIEEWRRVFVDLKKSYDWVQIFENKGAIVGCSNPHPHCQVWASDFTPNLIERKRDNQKQYFDNHARQLLLDYAIDELKSGERIIVIGCHFVALVPFWAVWPFETMILPTKRHIPHFGELTEEEIHDLANVMKSLLQRYNQLFNCEFPYSMGWFGSCKSEENNWQLHASYYPPLLRGSNIKKFMAGYELLCEPQRDITPENASKILRDFKV